MMGMSNQLRSTATYERTQYWLSVARILAKHGAKTHDDRLLDWATLEALAEGNGSWRLNIPNPEHMANALLHRFIRRVE